jgi:hypothetical protein
MKKIFIVSILLIPLMLFSIGFAAEPGPGAGAGERLVGPTINAVLGIINTPLIAPRVGVGMDVSVSGICNGQLFTVTLPDYLDNIDLSTVTVEELIGWRVATAYYPDIAGICNSKPGLEFMIIDVKKFNNYSSNPAPYRQITAEVTIMFVEATPIKK